MHTLTLTPPARVPTPTQIVIGDGATKDLQKALKGSEYTVMLFDEGIRMIAETIAASITTPLLLSVPSGDSSKSLSEADRIVSTMLDHGCSRRTTLVSIGGGMLTDLGGFVAGVFMRGVPSVLVPTTLLGMVDAAIGGKTAVNAGSRKNMIGSITHPAHVIVDTALLQKLPLPQLQEGLSEMIKIAAIADAPYFAWLEEALPRFLKRDPEIVAEAVERAVTAKVKIVEADDHDRDVRLLLNFGHTVAHAVEALSGYTIAHGKAVSIGVAAEMTLAGCSDARRVTDLLVAAGLPLALPSTMKQNDLWKVMLSDKKNEKGEVRIAVPKRLGEGTVISITEKQFAALFS